MHKGGRSLPRSVTETEIFAKNRMRQIRFIPRALGLVWAAAPGWTVASSLLLVIQGVLPVATVYLTRAVVNSMVAVVNQQGNSDVIMQAGITIVLMGLVMLVNGILGSVSGYVHMALGEEVSEKMHSLIQAQALSLDMQFYESPTYFDQLQRASIDAIDRPTALLFNISKLLQNAITLVAMGGILLAFAWWLPLLLLIGTLPALWVAMTITREFHRWRLENTINERRLAYYHRTIVGEATAPELRLFDLGSHFMNAHRALRRKLRDERLHLGRQQAYGQVGAVVIGLLTVAGALLWMARQTLQGVYNLGDVAMLFQAMNQGQQLMRSLLTGVGEIYRNLLFLEDLFSFLELLPATVDAEQPIPLVGSLQKGVELSNVTFQYPYSDRMALRDFNLSIPAGQVVAIVGENGAGKSTLLKLLCRFYDPQAGTITWDGVDLRHLRQSELHRRISVLFQQPVPYHESVATNIAFGDINRTPSRAEIEAAAQGAGADIVIAKLPEAYDTMLSKLFGRTQLSTGEWQRLALARAFVRQADLVILDEPTSAMDSWAENEWMSRFRDLIAGRTAVIITHRFTTAMQADMIHVMVDGGIVESGKHDELVRLGGRYAQSWRQQMSQGDNMPQQTVPV